MNDSDLFDNLLTNFQDDLKRIIGKFKGLNHKFTDDEMLSEANHHLIKNKDNIISYRDEEKNVNKFTEIGFRKAAYSYTKNMIGWSQSRQINSSYVRRRVDNTYKTETGEISTFDLLCETLPTDENYHEFDRNSKFKYVIKLLTQYTEVLSQNELKIMKHMIKGKNQYTIAQEEGVTHQAVSIAIIKLEKKIKNYLKFDYKTDLSSKKITKGNNSLKSLLSSPRKHFLAEESKELIAFVENNYKVYTSDELTKVFKNGKFERCQILSILNFNKLGNHIIKKIHNNSNYTEEESNLIIQMVNKGNFVETIAKALNRNNMQICSKCSSLKKNKLIKKYPKQKSNLPKYSDKEVSKMLVMFKDGLSSKDVAKHFNASAKSIGAKRASFCRKGLIGLSKKSIMTMESKKKRSECLLVKS